LAENLKGEYLRGSFDWGIYFFHKKMIPKGEVLQGSDQFTLYGCVVIIGIDKVRSIVNSTYSVDITYIATDGSRLYLEGIK